MKRHLFLYLVGLLFLIGCEQKQPVLLSDHFEHSEKTEMQPQSVSGMELLHPRKVAFADNKLIVSHSQGENLFSVFSADDGHFLYRFGNKGKSNPEILMPYNLFSAGNAVGAYDMSIKRAIWYDSLPEILSQTINPRRIINLQPDERVSWSIGIAAGPADGYIGECITSGTERFVWSDSAGRTVTLFGEYPAEIEALPNDARIKFEKKFSCYGSMAVCGQTFMHAALNRNELLFYDIPTRKDQTPELIRKYDLGVPDDRTDEAFMASFDAAASDSLFFVLYRGKWFKELNLKIDADQVLVFDRLGDPVKRLVLDKPASAIAVTPDGKTIYALGTDHSTGEPQLYKATVNQLK